MNTGLSVSSVALPQPSNAEITRRRNTSSFSFFTFAIAVAVTFPLAIGVGDTGGKAIDLIYSDLLLVAVLAWGFLTRPDKLFLDGRATFWLRISVLAVTLYGILVAGVFCCVDGDMLRLVSAAKFLKPLMFAFAGIIIASQLSTIRMLRALSASLICLVLILFFSTICEPAFPYGRWGQRMFFSEASLYGFPNMSQSFFAATSPFILVVSDVSKSRTSTLVARVSFLCVALLVVGSMSRSSCVVLGLSFLLYLSFTKRAFAAIVILTCLMTTVVIGAKASSLLPNNNVVAAFEEKVEARVDRTFDGGDSFSGRSEIWHTAIDLILERPVFGYGFESFSKYATHDTPHQQYLEIIFKFGIVGFLSYLTVLAIGASRCVILLQRNIPKTESHFYLGAFLAFFLAVLAGNMSQPNFSYSLTGNFMFFLFGLIHEGIKPAIRNLRNPA